MRVSISTTLSLFVLTVTVLMSLCVAGLINTQVGQTIDQVHGDIFRHQSQTVRSMLDDYFEDRISILRDQASFTAVVNGVMEPTDSQDDLIDFMADINLLGERSPLFLFDYKGRLIHATVDGQAADFRKAPLVDALIDGGSQEFVSVEKGDDGNLYWEIAVPVLYGAISEGILLAEMPLQVVDEGLNLTKSLGGHGLDLIFRGQTIASFGEVLDRGGEDFAIIGSELVGRFYWNSQGLDKKRQNLLFNLVTSLVLSGLIVALVVLVSARRLISHPIKQFRYLTHSLAANAGDLMVPTDHHLEELAQLAIDFNIMVTEVTNREVIMQDLLENMETRVQLRTEELNKELAERRRVEHSLTEARQAEMAIENRIEDLLLRGRVPQEVYGSRIGCLSISSQHLAGDFCEFIAFDRHMFDVLIGDVMGKGAQAALIGAGTKQLFLKALGSSISSRQQGGLPSPAGVVSQVHDEIIDHLFELESFVTLVYARFDLRAGTMELVDCGHTQTLIYRKDTDLCEFMPGVNVPIGFKEDEAYTGLSAPLQRGDVVLFYSDGITEAESADGIMFSSERLSDFLRQHHELDPQDLTAAIRQAVSDFTGQSDFKDDFTCIAVSIDRFDEEGTIVPPEKV